jgi:hypothetical protein
MSEQEMDIAIEEYEKKNGEIIDYKKIFTNRDDEYVWQHLPLTDKQKKYIFINILNESAKL